MVAKISAAAVAADVGTQAELDVVAAAAASAALKMTGDTVQIIHNQSGAVASGTTTIPNDDTIPTSTEGNALSALDTTITPTSATNKLLIEVSMSVAASLAAYMIAALYQDAGAAAIAVKHTYGNGGAETKNIEFKYMMTAGTTSATTFKIRAGLQTAGTITINGTGGSRFFGGVLFSSVTVTEIKV